MTRRGALGVLAVTVVVMGALLVTALADPVEILSRPRVEGGSAPLPSPPPTLTATSGPVDSGGGPESGWEPPAFVGVILQALLSVVLLAVLFGVAVAVQALVRRRPRIVVAAGPSFELPPVPDELLRSAGARMALLESGEPRNAIVAAWLDLESAAAAGGLPRDPSETSTEYTTRVIGVWDVDQTRLTDLAALYREARFSRHELGEAERRRAMDDLGVLHDDLERAARTAPQEEPA
jgi:hypothetical protein